ncbi:MAG TPA: type II secretion system protein GspN [Desulfatiglandales bacterium]|nr:type II secretion system protein GspN [Desulfatiglandales bacterium]
MKEFIFKNKKWFGYIIYCIILTVVFLYYRFPSESLRDYIQAKSNNLNPFFSLSVGQIKPWPPFWLKLSDTEFSLKNKPSVKLFSADSLFIKPQALALFRGDSKYCFECLAYGGDIEGCIDFKKDNIKAPFTAEIEAKDIKIGDHKNLKDLIGRHVDGILNGTIHYGGERKNLINGSGKANLELLDGEIELLLPILNLESIKYNEIKVDMVLEKSRVNLTRFELKGPLLKSMLSGTISLKEIFGKSVLDLKGTIEPHAELFKNADDASGAVMLFKQGLKKGTLGFIVKGTIDKPRMRFT